VSDGALRETYREILVTARRFTRSDADARDLVQDVLEMALGVGVSDWSSPQRRAWLRGVVRKRAAFVVRGQIRRRGRELLANEAGGASADANAEPWRWQPEFLASLPRSLRIVAALASADLCAVEIRWLLRLTDTALRQRLSALRRTLRCRAEPPISPAPAPPRAFVGQRAQLLAHLRRQGSRALATHDPDGHVIFLKIDAHEITRRGNP
jgi:RNA polymerase sigma-70 factor (ECF subfamily)